MAKQIDKMKRALEALSGADFTTAIELLSEVAADDGENAEVWTHLGVCYLETRQFDLALEALHRATQADPENATAHYLLGSAFGSSGNLERAAACYRRALEFDPQHAKAEEFLIKTEALIESREHYRAGVKLLYAAAPAPSDLNQAIRELIQSVALFDQSPARDSLLDCARRLAAQKSEMTLSVEIDSENEIWAAACERGWQCIRFGNWIGAQAAYDEALAYRYQDAFVHHALGFCFAELGALDNAVRAWLRALELEPRYDFSRFGRIQKT